jgi:polyferredoxin
MKINWKYARRFRQVVQVVFFLLFVYLLFAGLQRLNAAVAPDLFFRLDPLAALTAMLAARAWIPRLGWALLIVALTVLLGRAWCGWICPFGTLLEWVSLRSARKRARNVSSLWRSVKYLLLVAMLAAALFGNLSLGFLDPIALITRAMTVVVLPGLNFAFNAAESSLYSIGFLRPAIGWLESVLRGPVLPVSQPVFQSPLWVAVLFFGILALNLVADRFWCRYLCPLGGLLGLLSKVSILRPVIGNACNGCTRCAIQCRPGAIKTIPAAADTARQVEILPSECTVCLDCLEACARDEMTVRPVAQPAPAQEFDLTRRQFLQMLVLGAAGAVLLRTDLRLRIKHPRLIRPPGVSDEAKFLSKCLRCTECMKICPTTALQPAQDEAGVEGAWTPVLVPRAGYCDYGCSACGQACPSGAIPLLALEEKRQAVLGKAAVNRDRCLPWASNTPCIVCEEMCPTPEKSIRLEEVSVTGPDGETVTLQRPYVLRDLCIGCGICENHCPLGGEAGILVYSDI